MKDFVRWLFRLCLLQEAIIVSTLVALLAVIIATLQRGAPLLFDFHPLLMTVAYGVLMTWSIWSYLQPFLMRYVQHRYHEDAKTGDTFIETQKEADTHDNTDSEGGDTAALLTTRSQVPHHPNAGGAIHDPGAEREAGVVVYPWAICGDDAGTAITAHPIKREQARERHKTLNLAALVCASGGLLAIVINKLLRGKSLWPHTLHAYIGFATLLTTIIQASFGLQKYSALGDGRRIHRWHGWVGKLIYVLGNASVVLGIFDLWGITLLAIVSAGIFCTVPLGMMVLIQKANEER
eukprot:gb/GECG01000992.1/.p1 GENE.gb/GECG01000992.1/~~gb/GECG01000992.1/.p1  ORF type:complete len:293 (+),score=20.42 gb/GECG01000992.1/:1-879(+)